LAETTRKGRAAKPSIASHPLFTIIVVLWFGALFGLASLAIRPALMEGVVAATGIDRLVPMAAPPLGHTARILIVLLMTILGCLVGALVARRVAKPAASLAARHRRPAPEPEHNDDEASPVGLFGAARPAADEEDAVAQPARRRRQLALMPQDEVVEDAAPLPGNPILSVAELPLKSFDEVDGVWLHDNDRPVPRPQAHVDDQLDRHASIDAVDEAGQPEAFAPVAQESASDDAPADGDGRSNRLFESYVRRVNAGVGSNDSDLAAVPGFASIPPAEMDAPPIVAQVGDEPAYANTAERIATAPLDALSHVELLERLAQTIARRRAQAAQREADATATPIAEPIAPARFGKPLPPQPAPEMPAALRPHWAVEDDAQDDALPSIVPPRSITMTPAPALPADDADILAVGYSSLRGMTKTGPHEFVRIDEPEDAAVPQPPVFAFPGLQEAAGPTQPERRAFDAPQGTEPAPDQTEQALRAALATLRRMSGAA
jgi:hypothetical protein